jgi:plasmid stability protein
MEDEARSILREALARDIAAPANLAKAIASRFQPFGGVELELPTRESMREPPQLDP